MYARQPLPVSRPVEMRLIGVLDKDLIASFVAVEGALTAHDGRAVLVDVRDVQIIADKEVQALIDAVRNARAQGRDVRLDARGVPWRRLVKKNFSVVPAISAELRSDIRRTVIVAHSSSDNTKGKKRK